LKPHEIITLRFRSFVNNFDEMACTLLALLLNTARFLMLCLRPVWALAAQAALSRLRAALPGLLSES
jgi:hypothetical protein